MFSKIFDCDWIILAFVLLVILASSLVHCDADAQRPRVGPVPEDQLTPQTRLWLARGMVSEAGWLAERDHAGIAHTLARRWRARRERWPGVTFEQIIRHYCAGFYLKEAALDPRQLWVRQLNPAGLQPAAWPSNVRWDKHLVYWRQVLHRVDLFAEGRLPDPCRGQSWHWGSAFDDPPGRMVKMDCGETKNIFYTLVPKTRKDTYARR
jgi:hypothetical protein